MDIYLGHATALEYWSYLALDSGAPVRGAEPASLRAETWGLRRTRVRLIAAKVPDDKALADRAQLELAILDRPLHLLVSSPHGRRVATALKACHVWSRPVPVGSFVRLAPGILLSTPEFAFLQMAYGRSDGDIMRLAYEMCGTYVRSSTDSRGFRERAPLTSVNRLTAFIQAAGASQRSRERLAGLLKCVADCSASPMESITAISLCATRSRGGFGMTMPELNGRVDVPAPAGRHGRSYWCDFLWRRQRVAVEYDSDLVHTGSERIARDSERRNALLSLGFSVITITRRQFFDDRSFCLVAGQIAAAIGQRPDRGRHRYDWETRFMKLRRELLEPQEPWASWI